MLTTIEYYNIFKSFEEFSQQVLPTHIIPHNISMDNKLKFLPKNININKNLIESIYSKKIIRTLAGDIEYHAMIMSSGIVIIISTKTKFEIY